MRRVDREVKDKDEIFDIIKRCDTVRLGLYNDNFPYIVPLSFGSDKETIYFHSAREGLKLDLIAKNPNVCVEGDIFVKTCPIKHGITTRYESFIGFGKCEILTDETEILRGLKLITEHYGYFDYPLEICENLKNVVVGKIVLEEVTGKRNLEKNRQFERV